MASKFKLILVLSLLAGATALPGASQVRSVHFGSGEQWLSWSASEREIFVFAYIDGHYAGTSSACRDADDLFETNEPHHPGYAGHPSDFPSERCLAKRQIYSKARSSPSGPIGLSIYTGVITEFYTRHPEYRRVPFNFLMMYLSDRDFKTADQLYEMAKKHYMDSVFVY